MPFVWQDNPVYLEHAGPHGVVTVYRIFKDDQWGAGWRAFWFGLTPYASDEGDENGEFDVRDLVVAEGLPLVERDVLLGGAEEAIRATIIRAIESGELHWENGDA